MNKKHYIICSIILVVACLVSFNLGVYYVKNTRDSNTNINISDRVQNRSDQANPKFQNGGGGMMNGEGRSQMGRMTTGEVLSVDGNTMTVKIRDGGSKLILLSTETKYSKTVDSQVSDLTLGTNVVVNGSANQDGSISAEIVQIR